MTFQLSVLLELAQSSNINHCAIISSDIDVSFTAMAFSEASPRFLFCIMTNRTLHKALLIYDYMLTIAREIELFWQRPKRSWGFTLFVANRYISVLGHAPTGVHSFWSPSIKLGYSVGLCYR